MRGRTGGRWALQMALLALALAGPLARGEWVVADDEEQLCQEKMLCTNSNFTWFMETTFGKEDGCALLEQRGIKELRFYGDSFMRHMYVGVVLTLTGNYRNGALQEGTQNCDYNQQFEEKRCRTLLQFTMPVCGGAVLLYYAWGDPPFQEVVCGESAQGTLALWSVGNHPLEGVTDDPRQGRNSVPHYTAIMQKEDMCPFAAAHSAQCRLWWVTTHQRLNTIRHAGFPTENHFLIREFNVGMRQWFEAGACGPAFVVDVFNMTQALVDELPDDARALTHDSFHWSEVVNLLKAQILLNDIAAQLPPVPGHSLGRALSSRRRSAAKLGQPALSIGKESRHS